MGSTIPPWVPPVTPSGTLNGQRGVAAQTETVAAVDSVIPIAYGEVQVGGRIFAATYTGGFWYVGALFCLGEIDSFVALYLDGVDVKASTPAGMTVTFYTGTTSQTADATLAGAISGYSDTLVVSTPAGSVGVAYVVLKYTDAHYSGLPKIVARIKGRKVAPISQNLITDSASVASWSLSADATAVADATLAPDGSSNADKLNEVGGGTGAKYAVTSQIAAANVPDYAPVTTSIYVLAAERTQVRINFVDKSGDSLSATVSANLSTGVITGKSGAGFIDGVLAPMASGWFRLSLTASAGTGTSPIRSRIYLINGTASYTGTAGQGLYLWGGQIELKPSAGVYTETTTTATAVAYSENPVLCLRDLILSGAFGAGEDVDDLSAQAAAMECDAVVSTEFRRKMSLLIDSPRPLADWIATLAAYCGAFVSKDRGRWTFVPDRPATIWQFDNSTESWTGTNATLTTSTTALVVTATGTDPTIVSPSSPYINRAGSQLAFVRARIRRTSGAGGWNGSCNWTTSFHGFGPGYQLDIAAPAGYVNGDWVIVEWDLRRVVYGGDDWTESIIRQIRLRFWSGSTDVVEVGYVAIGIEPITTSDIVRGTFTAGTIDRAQIPTVVRVAYTDTSTTEWRSRDAVDEQSGVSTGTVPRRESAVQMPGITRYSQAMREAVERRRKLMASLYCEFVRFDLGLRTQVGGLLSIKHPYIDTAGSAENVQTTLFRVTAADVVGPGRVRVRAVQYVDNGYVNTESSTTWAAFLRRAGNLGGSGEGINRVPARFAGGWATSDYDGQFPVAKGADVLASGVGFGSSPDPTSGYYGACAMKIQTGAGTTARTVWLGSSSTDYNVPIDPRSKWLAACKFWPRAANTPVDFVLKSSAGTTYTLTDSTSTAQTWNDFVDTSSGANLFNLVNDTSDRAAIQFNVKTSSTSCWFDGIMLEKQVGNGAVVSPWRPPVASATNPARMSARMIAPGVLDDSVQLDVGNGIGGKIVAGLWNSATTDGTTVTFPITYATPPRVVFHPGALTNWNAYAADFALICEARNITTTQFTAFLKIRQTNAGAITTTTDSTVVDEGTSAQPRYTIHKTVAAQAWDDRYTFQFDATIKNIKEYEPGWNGYTPGDMNVGIYVALSNGVWTLVASVALSGSGSSSATTTRNNVQTTVTVDGLGQHAGKEFGIAILSESVPGGSINFDSVTYGTATAPTETTATPTGVAPVPFTVFPV